MKLEVFERIMLTLYEQQEKSHALYKVGIDLMNYEEGWSDIISMLIRVYYGEQGADWIDWYIYERPGLANEENKAWDSDGNPICYDIPSLWKCVEECRVSVDFKEYSLPATRKSLSQSDLENIFKNFI
jgi:hypothetical protein